MGSLSPTISKVKELSDFHHQDKNYEAGVFIRFEKKTLNSS